MRGKLEIVFWGVRGSIPVSNQDINQYGGSTSCVEVIADNGTHIVFDGGSGIHPLGNKYMKEEYILTSIDKNDSYHVRFIDKFYSLDRAEKAYKEAKKDIQNFRKRFMKKYESKKKKEVYKLAIQLFPLSKKNMEQ